MKTYIKNLLLLPALVSGFNLVPAGQVTAQTFTILHRFDSYDGSNPVAELILSSNTLYGTTSRGGTSDSGTVFAIKTDGTGFTSLHSFSANYDYTDPYYTNSGGLGPRAGLVLSGDTLYGTASGGGYGTSGDDGGSGTVFAVKTDGTAFTTLHIFAVLSRSSPHVSSDGAYPRAGLILSGDTLYGTASGGGSSGDGTVFGVKTNGEGFTNLRIFNSYCDGSYPDARLILSGNTLYGTTRSGGDSGNGMVFKLNTDATGFTNLHSFKYDSDGAYPGAGLILSGNTLYGTAFQGGSSGAGTLFAVSTSGTGFTNLHSFTAGAYDTNGNYTNSDGARPTAGLILSGNTLYGTALQGGSSGAGTVFAVNTDGTDFATLHFFTGGGGGGGGGLPYARLLLSGNTLYGTTSDLYNGYGTVFSLLLALSVPTIVCSAPLILECSDGAAMGAVHAEVEDTNGNPLQVVWTMDGKPFQTNDIPSGGNITVSNVSFTANFGLGEHVVVASASNGQMDPVACSTTVTVLDTTPPRIKSIVSTPNALWPPNHRMVPVSLKVEAVDNCDSSPTAKITNVMCNEPRNPIAPDWEITGAQTLNLRAERLGKGPGRVYTIMVECKDSSGNVSIASVDVTVPRN